MAQVEQAIRLQRRNKFARYFPDAGPLRRELYPKHVEFFAAGARHFERLFMAANKVGKTQGLSYETVAHATGNYPHWWPGHRFAHPITGWVCNTNWETVRDVNQLELIGPPAQPGEWGTGMIPADSIRNIQRNSHVKNGVLLVQVRYRDSASEISELQFKNYEQGRMAFQGTNKDWIWYDEELPIDVYGEMLLRVMTSGGHLAGSYTPLLGMTPHTLSFMPGGAGMAPQRA